MAYTTKVRKIGNSHGVILSKEILQELQVEEGQALYITKAPDGGMRITAGDAEFERQLEIGKDLMKRYPNTLRELAK